MKLFNFAHLAFDSYEAVALNDLALPIGTSATTIGNAGDMPQQGVQFSNIYNNGYYSRFQLMVNQQIFILQLLMLVLIPYLTSIKNLKHLIKSSTQIILFGMITP